MDRNESAIPGLPVVSVLMTSYNCEKYIGDAIRSVLSSTFNNFELIIVDDQSKDASVQVAKKFALEDPRVSVYLNEKNLGDYPNRNRAASYARGKYLKYVDCDDYIYPWGLELLVGMMEKFPDAGWGLCSLDQNEKAPFPIELTPKAAYEYNYLGPGLFHKAPLSSIIKREVFIAVGGFLPVRIVGDLEMWHRLALRNKVVLMPGGISWNRVHQKSEMRFFREYLVEYEKIMIFYLKSVDCPLDKESVQNILRKRRQSSLWQLLKSGMKLDLGSVKLFWKTWRSYN